MELHSVEICGTNIVIRGARRVRAQNAKYPTKPLLYLLPYLSSSLDMRSYYCNGIVIQSSHSLRAETRAQTQLYSQSVLLCPSVSM
jgi:hypothetical protein